MSSKILFIHAHGLRNDAILRSFFGERQYLVRSINLNEDLQEIPNLSEFKLVFISGAMGNSLADHLQVLKLGLLFKKYFSKQKPAELDGTRFYAFGKGALTLLSTGLWAPAKTMSDLKPRGDTSGPWRNIQIENCDIKKIMALQLCELSWAANSPLLSSLPAWGHENSVPCAWALKNLYFSDVDFLALKDPGLHPNYGYFDSSFISTVGDILDKMKW